MPTYQSIGPYAVPILSNEWWINNIVTSFFIFVFLFIGIKFKNNKSFISKYTLFIGLFFITRLLWNQWYQNLYGQWNPEWSLPIQMCSFSAMLSGIIPILIYFNINDKVKRLLFEFMFYWGIGAVYALLTPQYTHGTYGFIYQDYYISHGGIIFVILFCIFVHDFKPREYSWLKIFGYSQIVLLIIHFINRSIGGIANYFYTIKPPIVDNPFVMGQFPFHIIMLDIFALFHFSLLYFLFKSLKRS